MIDLFTFSIYLSVITSIEIGIFILIEAWQLKELIKTSKQTNLVLKQLSEDPNIAGAILRNGVLGMAHEIKNNPEMGNAFFEFVSAIAFTSMQRITSYTEEHKKEISELITAGAAMCIEEIKNNDKLQDIMIEFFQVAGEAAYSGIEVNAHAAGDEVVKKVKDTIDKEFPIPKKYRWIAAKVQEHLDQKNPKTPGGIVEIKVPGADF